MPEDIKECPNCGEEFKKGLFTATSNNLISLKKIKLINRYSEDPKDGYCNKCGDKLYSLALGSFYSELNGLKEDLPDASSIPIITIDSPKGWDYTVIGIITSQTVLGTGVITSYISGFSNFTGTKSKSYDNKIEACLNSCYISLRESAIDKGANAIIATKLDFSELGSGNGKGMILVNISGTAVCVENISTLMKAKNISNINLIQNKINILEQEYSRT